MKKSTIFLFFTVFASSLACQFLMPSRNGAVISDCAQIVSAMATLQAGEIPEHLSNTGIKQGDELDVNQYFDVLTHISMQDGYALDYVYQNDDLGGYPLLYPRPVDQVPYASTTDIPENTEWPDFQEYVDIEDTERGYFDYVVLDIMANQFYLFWHANYNDRQIVCNRQQVNDIVQQVSSGDFGNAMGLPAQTKARAIKDVEPVVRLTGDVATVELITFTKWGGFYRETYTVSREVPHEILEIKQENLVPYDCGILF